MNAVVRCGLSKRGEQMKIAQNLSMLNVYEGINIFIGEIHRHGGKMTYDEVYGHDGKGMPGWAGPRGLAAIPAASIVAGLVVIDGDHYRLADKPVTNA